MPERTASPAREDPPHGGQTCYPRPRWRRASLHGTRCFLAARARLRTPSTSYALPLRATLASQGLRIDIDQRAIVENLRYGGDEGGVLCGLRLQGVKDAVVVSITHLQPEPAHPLAPMIIAYQRRRVAGIARQHRQPATQRSSRKSKPKRR